MKIAKRFFLFLLVIVFLIIVAGIAIPYFYKDEIVQRVKQDINKNINATVEFSDVSLSLFKNFPNFSFSLDDLLIKGKDDFEDLTLTAAKNVSFTLDLKSVIDTEQPIEVKEVQFADPTINLLVLKNGKANYDITIPSEEVATTSESSGDYNFLVMLQKYGISSGDFSYVDKSAGISVKMKDINHQGQGDFTQTVFDFVTQTNIDQMTIQMGGVNYLYKTKGDFDITFKADLDQNVYSLKDNDIRLNDLRIKADGDIKTEDFAIYDVNIDFDAPANNFKNFLSLIPNAYTKDYADVKATGNLKLKGNVNGVYDGDKERYPAFKILLDIDNGTFQYPGLPLGVKDIITKMVINSPSSDFDKMAIDIPSIKLQLGQNPFEAQFKLRTPISDPDIDTKIKGKLDLSELAKAFPMEGVENMAGLIDANLTAKARMSDMDRQDYENVDMSGQLKIAGVNYVSSDMPAVKIKSMSMDFTPKEVNIPDFDMKLGKSDMKGSGSIQNILAYFSPEKTMKGRLNFTSNLFDANEWLTEEETVAAEATPAVAGATEEAIFDRFDFDVDAKIGRIAYDVYELDQNYLKGNLTSSKISIDKFGMMIGQSDLSGSGKITNVFNYLFENETLGGKIAINSKFFDLNPFMEEAPAGANPNAKKIAGEELEPFLVPDNIDMVIDANIGKVLYTDLAISDLKGALKVKDEAVRFDKCKGKTMGGNMMINGGYDTKDPEKPAFDLDYKIDRFDFQKSFKAFNSFALLAPIAKYIEGSFNSSMSFTGTLGKDLVPVLDNVNADGFLQTINSVVRGFGPLEKIGNTLNIDLFKKLQIKGTKNWFEIKDGKVFVKDFKFAQSGIDMIIGGSHGLSQDMDYNIKAKIPRGMLEKGTAGAAASKGIGFLKKEASKLGVNIDVGEFIDVLINLKGSVTKPAVTFKVLGAGGEKTLVETVKEEVKAVVEEKVEEVKTEVKEVVTEKKEDTKKKMDAEVNKIMATAEKQAANIRKAGKKTAEEARKAGYAQADNLVKQAGNNILKKKAAQIAAKKMKKETDKKVTSINQKADQKADQVMDLARKKVEGVKKKYGAL